MREFGDFNKWFNNQGVLKENKDEVETNQEFKVCAASKDVGKSEYVLMHNIDNSSKPISIQDLQILSQEKTERAINFHSKPYDMVEQDADIYTGDWLPKRVINALIEHGIDVDRFKMILNIGYGEIKHRLHTTLNIDLDLTEDEEGYIRIGSDHE